MDQPLLHRRQALELLGTAAFASVFASAQTPAFPKGAVIRTVLKDYAPEELGGGATLFHEHLQVAPDFNAKFSAATAAVRALNNPAPVQNNANAKAKAAPAPAAPKGPDIMRDANLMAEEVAKVKSAGISCIVDAGNPDMGRSIEFLRQVSMKSGVAIVAGGGYYSQPWYPKEISTMSEDQVYRSLLKMADDETLGAFGEIGSWDEMTAEERKVFRAIGRAHVATNIPIFTHTGIPGKAAIEQLDILEDQGVNPERVVVGHMGNLVDANIYVHKTLCRRGAFLGFDRQGGNNDAQQVPMVLALIEAGYAKNLLFSSDAFNGYSKTITVFLPKLKAAGVGDEILRQITVDNPRRFLAFVPKRPRRK